MVFIYVLQLLSDKYYVGKTENPKFRLDTHFKNSGCAWTKKYSPTQIVGLFPDCDVFDEDKYTIKYMKKYGIENVRGGSFCQITLDRETKICVERMICGAMDGCHFCGKPGHFIRDCRSKKNKEKYKKKDQSFLQASKEYESADEVEFEDEWQCSYCDKVFDTEKGTRFHENAHCKVKKELDSTEEPISGENLLEVFSELEKDDGVYTLDGKKYLWCDEELFEESAHKTPKQLRRYLEMNYVCDASHYNWKPLKEKKYKQNKKLHTSNCGKCGRKGHYYNQCYASRHIKGYAL